MSTESRNWDGAEFPYRRTFAPVDLSALRHNLAALRAALPEGVRFCAVVKADAYGHGFAGMAEVFSEYADCYAVAAVSEGIELRRVPALEKAPILILGDVDEGEYGDLLSYGLTASVSSLSEAEALSALSVREGKTAHIHIALDTGMSRIGLPADEDGIRELALISKLPGISIDGIFTHFATADETDKARTEQQAERFRTFLNRADALCIDTGIRHTANSAAILEGIGLQYDMVRGGIAMYGLYPSDEVKKEISLLPVMQLKARITHVKEIAPGTEVSYGGIFRAEKRMLVGTVSAGYADGYPRNVSGKGMEVLVRGRRCPVLGRVCMDQLMIGLDGVPEAKKGDIVTLFGTDGDACIPLEELAKKSGGFHYELLCGVNKRVPRVYFGGQKA
ncbi:MAG: alanine racemase [Eubacteriales bacterium]|nr:alanine racemase [Eubacteriales bacterium]